MEKIDQTSFEELRKDNADRLHELDVLAGGGDLRGTETTERTIRAGIDRFCRGTESYPSTSAAARAIHIRCRSRGKNRRLRRAWSNIGRLRDPDRSNRARIGISGPGIDVEFKIAIGWPALDRRCPGSDIEPAVVGDIEPAL